MADFEFGDLICYRYRWSAVHHGAVLYLGACRHKRTPIGRHAYTVEEGLIDLLDVGDPATLGTIDCRDPTMWQKCDHLGGFAPGIRDVSGTLSGTFTVSIGGVEVPATEFLFDSDRIVFDPPIVVTDDPIVITYDEP